MKRSGQAQKNKGTFDGKMNERVIRDIEDEVDLREWSE